MIVRGKELTSHEELRVRMPVDEELDALRGLGVLQPRGERGRLRGIGFLETFEVLPARIIGCAAGGIPLEGPVAVDIVANAGAT